MDSVQETENYEVHIGAFEGPMDLLLYLVQKNEVAPANISIAEITDQYLTWIKDLSKADLSKAGEFLLMASRLMAMKVRELLPKDEQTEEEQIEYNADREALLKEMLEYQRYKKVATELQKKEDENFNAFYRGRLETNTIDENTLADANIWQLFRAYQKTLKTKNTEAVHHIELDAVTIQDRQQFISNYLASHGRALFEDLIEETPSSIFITVTFMALLEMIKTDEIIFRQGELFGPLWIYRKKNNTEFSEEMANETRYYSSDPSLNTNLVEYLRSREHTISNRKSITIDAVMREATRRASEGEIIREADLLNMLEGKMPIPEDESSEDEMDESANETKSDSRDEENPNRS